MAKKAYVSNRFPNLKIQDKVEFQDGSCETENAEAQAIIEGHEWYGIHIHPRDGETPPAETAPAAEPASTEGSEESGFRARHGQRGTRG